jgi:ABC-type proline/glycine betaine transport system permease subunit
MVCVGLGACALRKDRYVLGGVLLAAAAMIRAFPAMAVFFLTVPLITWLIDAVQRERRVPDFRALLAEHRPIFRALAGATACVLVLFLASGLWFGFKHSWGDWAHKISLHSVQPNVNHVGLRTLIQFHPGKTLNALARTGGDWSIEQMRTFHARKPLFFAAVALFSLLAFAACRRRDLRQVALIGMMMIPIYFYPSNYYLHYVFVLPLLIDYSEEDKRQRWLWGAISVILLLMCVSEYWGFADIGVDERYAQWSVGLLVGYLVILVLLARDAMPRVALEEPALATVEPQPPAEPAGVGG